ncbi:MAG: ATP synthase F1 subunit gamma [Planctomycetes bacterium]|nr:ATP synthase F1 subunit gamma [Planctomycetota bacterium]
MAAVLSARVLKRKIRAVGNIKKITRAMQMVSAAKLKKVQQRLLTIRPYADKIREFMENLSAQVAELEYPLFVPRREVRSVCAVVIAADKGLCGSYNANLLRHAEKFLAEKGAPAKIVAVGRKSVEHFRKHGADLKQTYAQLPTEIPFAQIKSMTKLLVDMFAGGEADEVHLVFTRYVNAITFRPGHVQFLPIVAEPKKDGAPRREVLYDFEPKPAEILDRLIPRYVEITFHRLLLESMSSEHAARMNAMQNATENASDLIQSLTLQYNKSRQAGITKELLDIVGGAEALRG